MTQPKTDLEMMFAPADWPRWPYLPVKNGSRTGVLCEGREWQEPLFAPDVNMFSALAEAHFEPCHPEMLVEAGWVVD